MAKTSYEEMLNRSWDEIPVPSIAPTGTWLLKGRNSHFMTPREGSDTNPRMLFFMRPTEPQDDVDEAAVAELGEDFNESVKDVVHTIWIEDGSDWDEVRQFLKTAGIDTEGQTIKDSLKDFEGAELLGYLDERTFTRRDGTEVEENSVTDFAAVE